MGEKERKKHDKDRRREESDKMHDARKDVERQQSGVDDEPDELLDDEAEDSGEAAGSGVVQTEEVPVDEGDSEDQ